MIVGKAIYYLLTNNANIAALVDDRVYPEIANQQDAKPYVVYNVRSNDPSDTQKGPSELDTAAVEINCYAPNYQTAIAISVAVRAAIDRVQGTYNGVNVQSCQYQSEVMGFDEPQRLYRVMADYQVRILRTDVTLPQVMIDAGVYNLDDLSDVNAPNPTDGQALIYDDATSTWIPGDVSATLAALTDVNLDEPLDREALVYDEATTSWINGGPAKIDFPVTNNYLPGFTVGQVVGFNGEAQGDRPRIVPFSASSSTDPRSLVGVCIENMAYRANGHVRSYGTIYGLNTLAYPVGTILYASTTAGELTATPPTAPNHRIALAVVTRQHVNTGRIFVRTYTPAYRLADLSNVASTSPTTGQGLVWNGTAWAPGSVGYTPGSPPPGGFLGNVFYQDNAGNLTFEDEFRYTASTNTLAVENITGITVTGTGVVKGTNTYGARFATEAATNRALANATGVTVERYFTCTAEGNGESFNIQSNTPSAGNKIVRKIWYKNEAFEATDVNTWTLLHTFADDTAYASTETQWDAYLEGQTYGKPPFTLALSWEDVPAFTGLLDTYSGAAAAYSVRLLDSTYTGSCIRVRRASDNTEQDIGFDGNGDLDTGALTSFCTGTNGFVKTWYDQSGNARNATQATTTIQPKIYDSSTGVVLEGSFAGLEFVSSSVSNATSLSLSSSVTPLTTFVVAKIRTLNLQIHYVLFNDTSVSGFFYGGTLGGVNGLGVVGSGAVVGSISGEDTNRHLGYFNYNGTQFQVAKDGAAATNLTASGNFAIERIGRSGAQVSVNGPVQEIIMYATDQSANRSGIETNINNAFTIYGQTPTGLLADYPGAAAAYSVRQLISTARYAMAVRRASDNAVLPIGFVNGDLDTTTLAAFCSGTNGFVAVWYDQSGNGNHATQTTTANQPKIYDSSTGVLTEHGKPCAQFDGTNDSFEISSTISATNGFIVAFVSQISATGATEVALNVRGNSCASGNEIFYSSALNATYVNGRTSACGYQDRSGSGMKSLVVALWNWASDTLNVEFDGAAASPNTSITETSTDINRIRLGVDSGSSFGDCKIQECVIWPSNSLTISNISDDINTYFSIY